MKNLSLTLLLALSFILPVIGADISFSWTPNPPHEMVSSYRLEYKKLPAVTNWTLLTSAPGTTNAVSVKGIQPGYTYFFRMFASNSIGTGTNISKIIQIPTNAPTVVSNFNTTSVK